MNSKGYYTDEIQKLYFTIGEVAAELCVSVGMVRKYEKDFNLIIHRTGRGKGFGRKGVRSYTLNQLEKLKYIRHLLYVEGYKHYGAIKKFKEKYET